MVFDLNENTPHLSGSQHESQLLGETFPVMRPIAKLFHRAPRERAAESPVGNLSLHHLMRCVSLHMRELVIHILLLKSLEGWEI